MNPDVIEAIKAVLTADERQPSNSLDVDVGEIGEVRVRGVKGDKGDQGAVGPQGEQGFTGDEGVPGPKGDKGDRGVLGPAGTNGQDGKDGADGKRGPKGDKGDRGERGFDGEPGERGMPGPRGMRGLGGGGGGSTTGSGGSALAVKDEGVSLDTAVTSIDFAGAGVTATNTGHAVTVTIPGGGGLSDVVPLVEEDAGYQGVGAAASRYDHVHPAFQNLSGATPLVESGAGAPGVVSTSSRSDHVHPAAAQPEDLAVAHIADTDAAHNATAIHFNGDIYELGDNVQTTIEAVYAALLAHTALPSDATYLSVAKWGVR